MLTAVVTAVVVGAALGLLSGMWRRTVAAATAARRRLAADHRTIHAEPWPLMMPPECSTKDARLVVACAPSRSFRKFALEPSAAAEFGRRELAFTGDIAYSSVLDGIRLEAPAVDATGIRDHAWVCSNGKLQISITVPITVDRVTGRRVLALRDIVQPVARVVTAVQSAEYRRLHRLGLRASRMRTDWRIGVSMYSRGNDGAVTYSWQDLTFPGDTPSRLASDRPPFCPPAGYAAGELENYAVSRPPLSLIRTFLMSFLAENGYDGFDQAVDSTISAISASLR